MTFFHKRKITIKAVIIAILISCFVLPTAVSAFERNRITFINKSGMDALVKLVGPRRYVVLVEDSESETIRIYGGTYHVFVRYDEGSRFRYAKGEQFQIEDSAYSFTEASLTLHGVINGNYSIENISQDAFERY